MATKTKNTITREDQAIIDSAKTFSAFIRVSPTKKISEQFATLAEAAERAAALRDEHKGRDVIVYAMPDNSPVVVPVPRQQQDAARGIAAAPAPAKAAAKKAKVDKKTEPKQAKPKAEKPAKVAKPKAAKPEPATKQSKATVSRPLGKRAAVEDAARSGKLPPEPDFSAKTHERFRGKLAEVVAMAKAGDAAGLRAFNVNPISSSPKAIDRYRNLAIIAIEARA